MNIKHNLDTIRLTSLEAGNLWTCYIVASILQASSFFPKSLTDSIGHRKPFIRMEEI